MKRFLILAIIFLIYKIMPGEILKNNNNLNENKKKSDIIKKVENGLLKAFTYSASDPEKYNIYERMKYYKIPGISLSVIDNGKIVWTKGYGTIENRKNKLIKNDTLFQTGSSGKMIAALTVLSLVNKGILDLDTDINRYLKAWKIPPYKYDRSQKITLRQLLSHKSGLGHDGSTYKHDSSIPSLTDLLKKENFTPFKKPGEGYYYSGAGFEVIEQIIEEVRNQPYKIIATEEVLKPLGMKNTYFQIFLTDQLLKRAAFSHDRKGFISKDKYPIWNCFAPGTCNWSTSENLAKLFVELQKSYYGKSNKILPQSLSRLMLTNTSPSYGLGVKVIKENKSTFFGHSGDFYGFRACVYGYLEAGKGVVIMTNGANGVSLYNEIIRSVADNYNWPGCKQEVVKYINRKRQINKDLTGSFFLPDRLEILRVYIKNRKYYSDVLGSLGIELLQIGVNKFYHKRYDAFIQILFDKKTSKKTVKFWRIGMLFKGYKLPGFDLLYNDNNEDGIKSILKKKVEYSKKFHFVEVFNNIGYDLLGEKKIQSAINVFELAVKIFPESFNLYDSLGESYLELGNKKMAIKNYRKSLQLNSKNLNAKKMIEKLSK